MAEYRLKVVKAGSATGDVDVSDATPLPVTLSGAGTGTSQVVGPAADGAAVSGNPVLVAGQDGTNVQTLATDTTGNVRVVGSIAHDAADSGNPVKVGAVAIAAERTPVTALDRVDLIADLVGKLIILPYANPENFVSGKTAAITGTSDTAVIASAGGSLRNYVTSVTVTNSHATVGTEVLVKDGTTELFRVWVSGIDKSMNSISIQFPVPLRGTAATAINAANITTGSNTFVSAQGYKGV